MGYHKHKSSNVPLVQNKHRRMARHASAAVAYDAVIYNCQLKTLTNTRRGGPTRGRLCWFSCLRGCILYAAVASSRLKHLTTRYTIKYRAVCHYRPQIIQNSIMLQPYKCVPWLYAIKTPIRQRSTQSYLILSSILLLIACELFDNYTKTVSIPGILYCVTAYKIFI
jgi:hypothetical protein